MKRINNEQIQQLQELVCHESPESADAIVWLQGDRFDRGEGALSLWQSGLATVVVLTGNNELIGRDKRQGEENVPLAQMLDWLSLRGVPRASVTIDDHSLNTRDQAVHVLALAERHGWKKILLVGSIHHQLRPYLTFLKRAEEIGWEGRIINQPVMFDWRVIPGGRTVTAREIFADEVAKLHEYSDHVVSVDAGIAAITRYYPYHFRPATMDDAQFLLDLRNDPAVRKHFFQNAAVGEAEHVAWLEESLKNPDRLLYIVCDQTNNRIGQMRFDISKNIAEVSISLAHGARGRGLAGEIIKRGSAQFLREYPRVQKLIARIKSSNQGSIRVFQKAGYNIVSETDAVVTAEFTRL